MQLTPANIAIIAAGVAFVFWPQLKPFVAKFLGNHQQPTGERKPPAAVVVSSPAKPRSTTIFELIEAQDRVAELSPAASAKLGEAIITLISGEGGGSVAK